MMHKLSVALAITVAALFLMTGCEGDRGPAGPSGTAECGDCHNDDSQITAISAQWENSVHATGGNFERNTSPCSRCHTNEGFLAYIQTGDEGSPENPSAIGCFTCHRPHTNKNFDLTISDPLELDQGGTFDLGAGNLCANCHQARTPDPEIPPSGTIEITSIYWGPHHGTQANVLSGNSAYVFPGSDYRSSGHSTLAADGCPMCHMASPYGAQAGGHTMKMTYLYHGSDHDLVAGCNNPDFPCHTTLEDFAYAGVQSNVQALLDSLAQILRTNGLLDDSDHVIPGTFTPDQAGAVYNYLMMLEDRSKGVHNPAYVEDVLEATIAAVGP